MLQACQVPLYKRDNEIQQSLLVLKGDTIFTVKLYKGEDVPKVEVDKWYYWYKNNALHKSHGDFIGQLLHGTFSATDQNNNLLQKGTFEQGLKDGVWKSWNAEGQYVTIENWKSGVLDGAFKRFDREERVIEAGSYKNGKFFGKVFHYHQNVLDSITIIKNGEMKKSKVISENVNKKIPEIMEGEDTVRVSFKEKMRRILKKREKDTLELHHE